MGCARVDLQVREGAGGIHKRQREPCRVKMEWGRHLQGRRTAEKDHRMVTFISDTASSVWTGSGLG